MNGTDEMEWLEPILMNVAWTIIDGPRGREDIDEAKAAIQAKMQEREQAIWQRVDTAVGEDQEVADWNLVRQPKISGYGLGNDEGRNTLRAKIRQVLPELATVKKESQL